jgi:hypothetical protein
MTKGVQSDESKASGVGMGQAKEGQETAITTETAIPIGIKITIE